MEIPDFALYELWTDMIHDDWGELIWLLEHKLGKAEKQEAILVNQMLETVKEQRERNAKFPINYEQFKKIFGEEE